MNKIEVFFEEGNYNDYWNIMIDNFWLLDKLDELYSNNINAFRALTPTLAGMESINEQIIVWNRILPQENQKAICPILMCPDHRNFSCSLIAAEIENLGEVIQWNRIGFEKTLENEAEKIGTTVEWIENVPIFRFPKTDYIKMLDTFKEYLQAD